MTIRLYFDEDSMDRALVQSLKSRGANVTTAFKENMIEQNDEAHLNFATKQERVLYSFNISDFYHIHCTWIIQNKYHTGILLSQQQRYSVGEQMRRILKLMSFVTAEQMKNRIEFLSNWD